MVRALNRFVAGGGDPCCHPVGKGDHPLGDWAALGLVAVQLPGGECRAEGVTVLDPGVHALTTGRAAHVGGVPCQQQTAGPESIGNPVVHAEPRGPGQTENPSPPGGAFVQQPLNEGEIRRGRGVIHGGDNAVMAAGERSNDGETGGAEGHRHLLRAGRPSPS